ncbi:hypothetical protein [Streptomyces sp. WAC01280]|uniref:hypothetical protein n=1 Tax=Streptomyces sp. WAC01280 TaxID=2487424 RepID=UPI00163C594E|nr:hypothetical protein [Streptomyces sp. WAC01280]
MNRFPLTVPAGYEVGDWTVERPLGAGAFGSVYARRDAALRYARGEEELRLSPGLPPVWRDIVTDCLSRTHEERAAHDARSVLRRARRAAADRPPRLRRRDRPRRPRRPNKAGLTTRLATAAAGQRQRPGHLAGQHRNPGRP